MNRFQITFTKALHILWLKKHQTGKTNTGQHGDDQNDLGIVIDKFTNFVVGAILQLLRCRLPIHVRSPQQSVFVYRYTVI